MTRRAARILLYGSFTPPDFEYGWLTWLRRRNFTALPFPRGSAVKRRLRSGWPRRIGWRLAPGLLAEIESRSFVEAARQFRPDLVLVVSGNLITTRALVEIKDSTAAKLFHFYNEDMANGLNTKATLRKAIRCYDHVFTTKSFNVDTLALMGSQAVTYVPHGYRDNCHFPVSVNQKDRERYGSDVVFVGTWERPRAQTLEQLNGFDLRVWGNDWQKLPRKSRLRSRVEGRPVYGGELARVFGASKVSLSFLRKANRDLHTSRTFEIPACGGFQLSERTEEVLNFFEEGKEIECFSSLDELRDKITYYLKHESPRLRIAASGLERVRRSRYRFTDRLETILNAYSC